MSYQIIDVKMSPTGRGHQAIVQYQWKNLEDGTSKWTNKAAMVEWVRKNPNKAWVGGPSKSAWVEVVENPGGEPYLRTKADGVLTDNLLSLPGAR